MELVRVLPSADDEVNVACFHPSVGGGFVYGTKVSDKLVRFLFLIFYVIFSYADSQLLVTMLGRKAENSSVRYISQWGIQWAR